MPNKRADGQDVVTFAADVHFCAALELGCDKTKEDRSQFIRTAVWERLSDLDIPLDEKYIYPPGRVRKAARLLGEDQRLKAEQSLIEEKFKQPQPPPQPPPPPGTYPKHKRKKKP